MIKVSTGGRLKYLDIMGIEFQVEGIAISNALRLEHVCLVGVATLNVQKELLIREKIKGEIGC